MKQILITIIMLSIALALVIGIIVPIIKHSRETGNTAVLKGKTQITRIEKVLR